ncbi:MAG: proton-conducting transporter membrane subunit [Candidatus Nitrosopolaris sp.]
MGRISKKASYSFGISGSIFGIILSLSTLLFTGHSSEFNLWKITNSSSFEFVISPFNSYFLLISCCVWLGTCVYSFRYDDDYTGGLSSLLVLTMLSMVIIILSGDAISFLIGWESMTIASFFMILQGKGNPDGIRRAAFLFLAFGEASTVFVMLAFAGMFGTVGSFNFLAVSSQLYASGPIATWIFITALVGFGLKMGIAPFHISEWLPIAHSSAPTNASAVLSATLTLMGVYGFITVISHLSQYDLWWGWIALIIGGISALLGALFASVSEHTKGLPAYSTIENNGLIVLAIGAFMLASHYHLFLLADFALIAALYHAFSHSISKASLFLIMGWISKVKGSFDLNSIQNLVLTSNKKTKIATNLSGIITILSLAAMPPLAGFVSEWMILEVLFQSFRFGDTSSQIIGILVGAIAALAAGIIIVAMTKAYGFGILSYGLTSTAGRSKTSKDKDIDLDQSSFSIRTSFYYFLILIVVIGVAAPGIFFLASNSTFQILKVRAFDSFVTGLLAVPAYFVILSGKPFGGFSPTFTAIFMVCLLIVPFLISRIGTKWKVRRTYGWFGGGDQPSDPVELYNSFGYSTPIRIMLNFVFRTKETIVQIGTNIVRPVILSPEKYFVELEVLDVFKQFYDLLAKFALFLSSNTARMVMPGRLGLYLLYIMVAFIFVLLYILLVVI